MSKNILKEEKKKIEQQETHTQSHGERNMFKSED